MREISIVFLIMRIIRSKRDDVCMRQIQTQFEVNRNPLSSFKMVKTEICQYNTIKIGNEIVVVFRQRWFYITER